MSEGDRVLGGLDDAQREAVTALRGPVCVLAGAGTGKTRVITRRIAHGVDTGEYSPGRVMAVTFTTRAAGEMRGRLRMLGVEGVNARTFHSAALAQVNYFWPIVAGGEPAPAISSNKVRVLADAAPTLGLNLDTTTLRDVAAEIEWRKVSMLTIEQYARTGRPVPGRLDLGQVVALHDAYERLKDARRQLDFEDILLVCAGMIESEPRVARDVRERYRHFTVDEFQDVSPLQHRLLQLWLGQRHDLCVVGDASQTIYSFTGADSRFLLDFPREHPGALVVRLERNHRSTGAVLNLANTLMRGREGALALVPAGSDETSPAAGAGDSAGARGTLPGGSPRIPAGAQVAPTPAVRFEPYDTDEAEAAGVAAAIRRSLAAGTPPSQIAVLYRAHSQSPLLQRALADAGIAATVLGGKRFFDLPEVREALLLLRGESLAPRVGSVPDIVRAVLRERGFTDDPPPAGGAVRDAWESRAALIALAEGAVAENAALSLREFTDDLQARERDQHEPELATVTLSTLHAAKGLEWDEVHLVGLGEGLLPISYAQSLDGIDEERRLLYVGITRARRRVGLSWAAGRGDRSPSRFLGELGIRRRVAGQSR